MLGLMLFTFLGNVHLFDWDEANFAEVAREMIVSGNYTTVQIGFEPFWEKPPLFFWLQVVSMKIFGINEYAARFPNAICGIITVLVLYFAGKRVKNKQFGVLWALVYAGSTLPFFYFKSGLIDPYFNLFIFLGIFFTMASIETESKSKQLTYIAVSGVFIGLSLLTKGPVGVLIYGLVAVGYTVYNRFKILLSIKQMLVFVVFFIITGGSWFLYEIFQGRYDVVQDFVVYQIRLFQTKDAGHGGFLLYHFVVLFIGVFPASVFVLFSFFNQNTKSKTQMSRLLVLMKLLFWIVLILFTIVQTKIVHYSSLCYFPMSFLAAVSLNNIIEQKQQISKIYQLLIVVLASVYALLFMAVPVFGIYKNDILKKGLIADKFTAANLQANPDLPLWYMVFGIGYILAIVLIIRQVKKGNIKAWVKVFFVNIIFVFFLLPLLVPKVEAFSQQAAVAFYKSKQNEDVYVVPLYKTYIGLFYVKKTAYKKSIFTQKDWYLEGEIDKPTYFVCRLYEKENVLKKHPDLQIEYEKNGYVFFVRYPNLKK